MAILITGGAGYIGSHTVYEFIDAGYEVVVVDNLSTGFRETLPEDISFYNGNIADTDLIDRIFSDHRIDTVLHFAGSIVVPESVENPLKYFENNTAASFSLLKSCIKNSIKNFIFSSTASVYGSNPKGIMEESYAPSPENPYAASKLMTEMMIKDISQAHGLNYIILRYFNVAGADTKLRTGQMKKDATHLIKVACQAAVGIRPNLHIYGTDYPTPDGTCVRDYIHVSDLANAHLKAYKSLANGHIKNKIYNCGYGYGFSVMEVIQQVEKIAGLELTKIYSDRRAGDPVSLIANSQLLQTETGWSPQYDDLDKIILSALIWEKTINNKTRKLAV